MKKLISLVIVAITLIYATSCGTITGLNSKVKLDSNPQGADVILNNHTMGKTPIEIKLKNNTDYSLILRYPGFSDYTNFIDSDISAGVIVCDILFTGFTGIIVDAVTGGFYKNKELHKKKVLHDFKIGKTTIEKEKRSSEEDTETEE